MPQGVVLITIDVEDWFQVENFKPYISYKEWPSCEPRVHNNVREILSLLANFGVKATFFVLGWLAERLPELVVDIHRAGHEVASHGFDHRLTFDLSSQALEKDLLRTKTILESLGVEVRGYRAPSFTVSRELLKLLRKTGHLYDSSLNTFRLHGRYGYLEGASDLPFKTTAGILEIPVSNLSWGKWVVPWGGGAYFRLLPTSVFIKGVRRILKNRGLYVFYFHPWEIDPNQPRVPASWGRRFRHYYNLAATKQKLKDFLAAFSGERFLTCSQYLELVEKRGIQASIKRSD